MAGIEQCNVRNEEFMEEVARYECVYHRNSYDFKDKNKRANCCEKIGKNFNLYRRRRSSLAKVWKAPSSCLFKNILRPKTDVFDGFEADDDVA